MLFKTGLTLFCVTKYTPPGDGVVEASAHLTNTRANKVGKREPPKILISEALERIAAKYPGFSADGFWKKVEDMMLYKLLAILGAMQQNYQAVYGGRPTLCTRGYFFYGTDVMLDDRLTPMLLECNNSPGIQYTNAVAKQVIHDVVSASMDILSGGDPPPSCSVIDTRDNASCAKVLKLVTMPFLHNLFTRVREEVVTPKKKLLIFAAERGRLKKWLCTTMPNRARICENLLAGKFGRYWKTYLDFTDFIQFLYMAGVLHGKRFGLNLKTHEE